MTKTYAQFLAEPLSYSICQYGNGVAIRFKGAKEYIEKAHNLFCNFDATRKLNWLDNESAYISGTIPRIKNAIKLYLYLGILSNKEVDVSESWDEETGVYTLTQDEKTAELLAEEESSDFMAHLKTDSFISSRAFSG